MYYWVLAKFWLSVYNANFNSIYGIFKRFLVNYIAAYVNEMNGESKICKHTSTGFYLILNNRVHVAPIDLPQRINCLYPQVRK